MLTQVLKYYLTHKDTFPKLLYLMLFMFALSFVMREDFEPELIASILFMMNLYFIVFAKPYHGNENDMPDIKLPLSHGSLWFGKMVVFYLFLVILGVYISFCDVYRGEPVMPAIISTMEFLSFCYMFLFIAGRWEIFKSRNWMYPLASIIAMLVLVSLRVLVSTDLERLIDSNSGIWIAVYLAFMLVVSVLDFALSKIKR